MCKPYKKGCDYCARQVVEIEPGYKPMEQLVFEVSQKSVSCSPDMIIIKGNGDISCYPNLAELVERVSGGSARRTKTRALTALLSSNTDCISDWPKASTCATLAS